MKFPPAKLSRAAIAAPVMSQQETGAHDPNRVLFAVLGAGAPCALVSNVPPNPKPPAAAAAAFRDCAPEAAMDGLAMVAGLGGGGGGAGAAGVFGDRKLIVPISRRVARTKMSGLNIAP